MLNMFFSSPQQPHSVYQEAETAFTPKYIQHLVFHYNHTGNSIGTVSECDRQVNHTWVVVGCCGLVVLSVGIN